MENILTMTQEELKRLHVVRKAIDKRIKQREAADLLGLTSRQIRRLIKRVREESDKGIIHRSRGSKSHRATAEAKKTIILNLCRRRYLGFNPTFASEKLFENDRIKISRETLRQWFITESITYDKRKSRPHRRWRERKHYCGQMVQVDGSHHDWFEGRGKPCVLMGYIDDATSRVFARFYTYEGTFPAMDSFKQYVLKYGIPASLYLDRHTTYKSWAKASIEDELSNKIPQSQFESALDSLGVRVIHAQSPQAKGRIERLFKTLQDRLIKEMRLKNISSIAVANEFLEQYLPAFNQQFSVTPLGSENVHRPRPKVIELDNALCIRTTRLLRNDFTISHDGKLYQIEDNIRAEKVVMQEYLDGSLLITYQGRRLRYKEIAQRALPVKKPILLHKKYISPKDHPWRKFRALRPPMVRQREEVLAGVL